MKKFITLLLVLTGMVSTASAWNYLNGNFNSWADNANSCLDNGPVAVYLEASDTPYEFGIDVSGAWKGPNNNADITSTTTINNQFSGSGNFKLTASTSGYYVFSIYWSGQYNDELNLIVRYPDTKVYFYNNLGWENVYLHDGWWGDNDASGACNKNALRGVAMTDEGNNVYSAYIPRSSFYRITFTSDKQVLDGEGQYGAGYDHFYGTNVVWNADEFNTSTPIYVPTTTISETLNTSANYYYGGAWHAYPTYTRDVTEGNFGTICLPFDATVTGATVFKIVSTVGSGNAMTGINLESVDALEAGKAYIFKATSSKLTATYTGSYSDATEANGMMGNLSSNAASIAEGNYVVKDNTLRKVVSGGSGVTVGQYKAYVTLTGLSTAARGLNFMGFDDESTGIQAVETAAESGNSYFNLAGQRVAQPTKGLYIKNGKKVILK